MNLQQRIRRQVSELSRLISPEKDPALQELKRKTNALKNETQALDKTVGVIADWQHGERASVRVQPAALAPVLSERVPPTPSA